MKVRPIATTDQVRGVYDAAFPELKPFSNLEEAQVLYNLVLWCAKRGADFAIWAVEGVLKPLLWAPTDEPVKWPVFRSTRTLETAAWATEFERERLFPVLVELNLPEDLKGILLAQYGFRLKSAGQTELAIAAFRKAQMTSSDLQVQVLVLRPLSEAVATDEERAKYAEMSVIVADGLAELPGVSPMELGLARWVALASRIDLALAIAESDPERARALKEKALERLPPEGFKGKPLFFCALLELVLHESDEALEEVLERLCDAFEYDRDLGPFNKGLNLAAQALLQAALGDFESSKSLAESALALRASWENSEPRMAAVVEKLEELVH
jgi:hypothetical protein